MQIILWFDLNFSYSSLYHVNFFYYEFIPAQSIVSFIFWMIISRFSIENNIEFIENGNAFETFMFFIYYYFIIYFYHLLYYYLLLHYIYAVKW